MVYHRTLQPDRRVRGENKAMNYWLIKSEPDDFSFEDLWRSPGRKTHWGEFLAVDSRATPIIRHPPILKEKVPQKP